MRLQEMSNWDYLPGRSGGGSFCLGTKLRPERGGMVGGCVATPRSPRRGGPAEDPLRSLPAPTSAAAKE